MFCTTKLRLGESVDDPAAFDTETNSVHIITARNTNDAIMLAKFHVPAGILAQEDLENLTWKSDNGEARAISSYFEKTVVVIGILRWQNALKRQSMKRYVC